MPETTVTDLHRPVAAYGVEVVRARIDVEALWIPEHSLLVLGATYDRSLHVGLCRQALEDVGARA